MSAADRYTGSWISYDQLPPLRQQFERNRDPLIARQMDQAHMSEAERRRTAAQRDAAEERHAVKKHETPAHDLQPPPSIRDPVNRAHANSDWLSAERDAALSQCRACQQPLQRSRSRER